MIRFLCPSCSKVYKTPEEQAGKQTACKRCRAVFIIPPPEQPKSNPANEVKTGNPFHFEQANEDGNRRSTRGTHSSRPSQWRLVLLSGVIGVMIVAGVIAFAFSPNRSTLKPNSPSSIAVSVWKAANEGRYSEANEMCTDRFRESEEKRWRGGMQSFWDDVTLRGTITNIEVRSESIRGEGAVVDVSIRYRNDHGMFRLELIREHGIWKINQLTVKW